MAYVDAILDYLIFLGYYLPVGKPDVLKNLLLALAVLNSLSRETELAFFTLFFLTVVGMTE